MEEWVALSKLPEEESKIIGKGTQPQSAERAASATSLVSGKLSSTLADIDVRAEKMFSLLIKQTAEMKGVAEALQTAYQLVWMGAMFRNRAPETVSSKILYT